MEVIQRTVQRTVDELNNSTKEINSATTKLTVAASTPLSKSTTLSLPPKPAETTPSSIELKWGQGRVVITFGKPNNTLSMNEDTLADMRKYSGIGKALANGNYQGLLRVSRCCLKTWIMANCPELPVPVDIFSKPN